jgi:hypothetical protein
MPDSPVIQLRKNCPVNEAGVGCACFVACHELVDVVPAQEYWRVVGERDELRRLLLDTLAASAARFPAKP